MVGRQASPFENLFLAGAIAMLVSGSVAFVDVSNSPSISFLQNRQKSQPLKVFWCMFFFTIQVGRFRSFFDEMASIGKQSNEQKLCEWHKGNPVGSEIWGSGKRKLRGLVNYPVILRILGSSFSRKIHHPWLVSSPNITGFFF